MPRERPNERERAQKSIVHVTPLQIMRNEGLRVLLDAPSTPNRSLALSSGVIGP